MVASRLGGGAKPLKVVVVREDPAFNFAYRRPFTRQGLTLAAVRALSEFAFRTLALHRLEAACIPDNVPSRTLLKKAGFAEEGFAQAYLKINGAWRDHVLFGQLTPYRGLDGPDEGVSV